MKMLKSIGLVGMTALVLAGCGVNPVTGENELQFISEAQELRLGEQHYGPTQQSQGGSFDVLPELSAYVDRVGQKLAAVADRELPYEFVVLDNAVPNAWALPGGKIAVNRGLLTELDNEAELAAVLGHEIVHAAARHGAKAQERGTLLQAGLALATIGAAVGDVDSTAAGLLLQGAGVGAQLVQTRYGRDQELESDYYGMQYMRRAGYDPSAAVTLQETFVRLSQQSGREHNWLEGLFASHPPSPERVAKNAETAAAMGAGGELGAERYRRQLAPLRELEPAYARHEAALEAAREKDYGKAQRLASEAVQLFPGAGRFHQTLGDIALAREEPRPALSHYRKAIELNPDYFGSFLGAGIAQAQLGANAEAEQWLRQSMELLPTAPGAYYLGETLNKAGESAAALELYRAAAQSDSRYGQLATAQLVRLDLPSNPGRYLTTSAQLAADKTVLVRVQNRTQLPLIDIIVTPVLIDRTGRVLQSGEQLHIPALGPGEARVGSAGVGRLDQARLQALRFRIDSAGLAEASGD